MPEGIVTEFEEQLGPVIVIACVLLSFFIISMPPLDIINLSLMFIEKGPLTGSRFKVICPEAG